MSTENSVSAIHAREVLDSRGFPTVEVSLTLSQQDPVSALVPSGASTGEGEAHELRDGDPKRYLGKGVLKAVANVNEKIRNAVLEKSFQNQMQFDEFLLALDRTSNKSQLGANAILGASLAFAKASAQLKRLPLWKHLANEAGLPGFTLPVPLMNIINGGKHAENGLNIQEFMIIPARFERFRDALRAGVEIFHRLKQLLIKSHLATGVGDEGGFAPVFQESHPHEQAMSIIYQAIEESGYKPGVEVFIGLDVAASEFYKNGIYKFEGQDIDSSGMIEIYSKWIKKYPILSIEDGLAENDWSGWSHLTSALGNECQLVGDDLFVTNQTYLKKGIEQKTANAILIKLNQIGTVWETLETMKEARKAQYSTIVSHRSGETEDTFIADFCVATDSGQIKTGSLCRSERTAKYNQLLRIEESLGKSARFPGLSIFRKKFS